MHFDEGIHAVLIKSWMWFFATCSSVRPQDSPNNCQQMKCFLCIIIFDAWTDCQAAGINAFCHGTQSSKIEAFTFNPKICLECAKPYKPLLVVVMIIENILTKRKNDFVISLLFSLISVIRLSLKPTSLDLIYRDHHLYGGSAATISSSTVLSTISQTFKRKLEKHNRDPIRRSK